ncbi:ribosomal protein L7/L12 [Brucella pseudogrignonensis]|uniref:Ribosomal L7/L12 C-terminal domain protein n=1 Tax=Brucella pseudogrignonensis TaxID=419475 RepID=A0A256G053_9HYPH|nr:ribosomal protein L7/L12 [Brucella pseudogrignonensis]OYR20449.1 ribosomal L7/L12 C-terminal domain protein [Brucella pseudogrignonensis]
MGNVKVGDKVRSLVTQIDVRAGGLYEVKTVDGGDVWVIDDVGDNWYLASDEFETLPVVAKAQTFKVGDRVRLTANEGDGRYSGSIGVIEKINNNYARVLFDAPFTGWGETGRNWHAQLSDFVAAPLKIEAGKYYCTRDGRKAGPLMARNNDSYAFAADIAGDIGIRIFQKDGVHGSRWIGNEPNLDLIAEWVDEPVKAAAPAPFILRNDMFYFAPVAKPAIVALIENGQPKPSAAPHVHANETLAAKEATRLAGIHKGQEFGVYVLTQKVSEPAPSYKHEWQRFAAKGEKISAIKELRSVTGLGLRAAKDAVEHWIAHDEPYSRIAA